MSVNAAGLLAIAWSLWCILWVWPFGYLMSGIVLILLVQILLEELGRT